MYGVLPYIFLIVRFFRLIWNIAFIMIIYYTLKLIKINSVINISIYYYVILIVILSIQEVSYFLRLSYKVVKLDFKYITVDIDYCSILLS